MHIRRLSFMGVKNVAAKILRPAVLGWAVWFWEGSSPWLMSSRLYLTSES